MKEPKQLTWINFRESIALTAIVIFVWAVVLLDRQVSELLWPLVIFSCVLLALVILDIVLTPYFHKIQIDAYNSYRQSTVDLMEDLNETIVAYNIDTNSSLPLISDEETMQKAVEQLKRVFAQK